MTMSNNLLQHVFNHCRKKQFFSLTFNTLFSFKVVNCSHYDSNWDLLPYAFCLYESVNTLPVELGMMDKVNFY